MSTRVVKSQHLLKGQVMAMPYQRTATIADVPKVGRLYVSFRTEYGRTRIRIGDEVLVEPAVDQLTETIRIGEDEYMEEPMFADCYECGGFDGKTAVKRAVVRLFTTNKQDPTQAYELECGHSTIDC